VNAAEVVSLDGAMSVADAFRRLLRSTLRHWQVNQVAALAGQDEAVHQMRAAIRRVKTLFDLFRPYIAEADFEAVRRDLTRIGRTLGAARDWDVFVDETLASAAADRPTRGAAGKVAALAQPARRRYHQKVAEMIKGPRYAAFLLQMHGRLDKRQWLANMKLNPSTAIAEATPDLLDRQARKAFKAGKGIAALSADRRHDLRKKLKKLNYSVEFVGDLRGARAARRYSKRICRVLDVLGDMNDLAMADTCLLHATGRGSKAKHMARPLRKRWRQERAKQLARLPGVWRRFKQAELF
jgi:triphosphatase